MSSIQGVALTLNKLGLDTQNILLEAGVAPDRFEPHAYERVPNHSAVPADFPRGELRTRAAVWVEVWGEHPRDDLPLRMA